MYTPSLAYPYECSQVAGKACVCDRQGLVTCERTKSDFDEKLEEQIIRQNEQYAKTLAFKPIKD